MANKFTIADRKRMISRANDVGIAKAAKEFDVSTSHLGKLIQKAMASGDTTFTRERSKRTLAANEYTAEWHKQMRLKLRATLISGSEGLAAMVAKCFEEGTPNAAMARAAKDYAIAGAILLDKYRLEVGDATERTELVSNEARNRVADKLDQLAVRRERDAS